MKLVLLTRLQFETLYSQCIQTALDVVDAVPSMPNLFPSSSIDKRPLRDSGLDVLCKLMLADASRSSMPDAFPSSGIKSAHPLQDGLVHKVISAIC